MADCYKARKTFEFRSVEQYAYFWFARQSSSCFRLYAYIFYPSMLLMGGAGWKEPLRFQVSSNFTKKSDLEEKNIYELKLIVNGMIDVYKSEGSGRISGLSWSTGLVELSEESLEINKGDSVNFIPYSNYGI